MAAILQAKELLSEDLLLVDGLGRAGKQLVSKLVSNFMRVECFQYSAAMEQFPILNFLGHLDREPTVAFLRQIIDELVYNRMIGRNLNTRPSDASSILKSNDYAEYVRRSVSPEGDEAVQRFNDEQRFPCFMTHHALAHFDLFADAYPLVKLVHAVRHPVDLIHSWYSRDWGTRIGNDPRAFALAIEVGGKPIPWWSMETSEIYPDMSPIDRVISDVLQLQKLCDDAYDNLTEKRREQVLYVSYERLFTDAKTELGAIASFFGTTLCDNFEYVLTRERVPRPEAVSLDSRARKFAEISAITAPALVDWISEVSKLYEESWGLPALK